ncbi:AAA family ATPase [Nocardioides flavescens]|uniref:Nuclease SbcCD subunit C n=1 Tax=Nocardioides flavescens TaxID=2691959 RepID=A0A6L7ENF8_9ACTN|nr:AAA family ATPase [Nocardioides flavescens]
MRLHRLEVTAFGPFAGTVSVDFDRLSSAGLFLLSGATGAGKTSVLDAVCFALYGDVPGDRSTAKRLRADQAAPEAEPRVSLEATLSSRRFRIVRTPAWQRPKKRGSGTTTAQASVHVAERVGGEWVTLATRLDEAGLLISGLIGMNLTQFTQVAMLPQGRFQTFLRAKSEDRHRLLHQLFRTGRFEDVESWLRERRLSLRRATEAAHRTLADTVSRVSEAVVAPLPDGWDVSDLTEPASDDTLAAWAHDLVADTAERSRAATDELATATAAESRARADLGAGRALAERRDAVARAHAERVRLDEHEPEVVVVREELAAAARAAAVEPVHRLVTRASSARAAAHERLAGLEVEEDDRSRLVDEERTAVETEAAARAALPRERELASLAAEVDALSRRVVELDAEQVRTRAACEAADALVEVTAQVLEVERQVEAALTCTRLETELAAARAEHLDARELVAARRDDLFDVHRRRIEGMAAELAGALAVGGCCPVCGSEHHPARAVAAPGAPDESVEHLARQQLDDANLLEHAHASRVHDLTAQLTQARSRAGKHRSEDLREQLGALRVRSATLVAELGGAGDDVEALTARLATLDRDRAAAAERLLLTEQRHAEVAAELAELLLDTGADDLATLLARAQGQQRRARASLRALDEAEAAATAQREAAEAFEGALRAAGFAGEAAALGAVRTAQQIATLETAVREHERRVAAVASVLDAPGAQELLDVATPDLDALGAAHAAALDALASARSLSDRWARRAARLGELGTALDDALAAWRPLHADWRLTAELSAFCEGKAADNRLQMRLSAYVLAYRLSQVVAAANERLGRMSDSRYTLEHTGRAGAGETRGGLSLRVRDDWSGEARDPATLSGGETFVVSLALALGLADVITQEVGGADLDTLFVDEGFGSLDADTLDDVLDTLDSLRDGGRIVGVVSHVAEMRDRIPTQLVVTKARTGSTLAVHG